MRPTWSWPSTGEFPHIVIPWTRNHACVWIITTRKKQSVYHLSRLSLWASILQSLPLVCGASRLPHSFCLMDNGMRNAFGPTKVVMLLAGSIRDVSMHWTSWRDTTGYCYMWKVQYTTERRALLLSFWWCLSLRFLISWMCHSWPGGHSVLMNVSWQREQLLLLLWVIAVYFIY